MLTISAKYERPGCLNTQAALTTSNSARSSTVAAQKYINPICIGQVFGRLTAIGGQFSKVAGNLGLKASFVKCQCKCGNVRDFRVADLKRGTTVSCGCFRREGRGISVGQVFGRLTILGVPFRCHFGKKVYLCLVCECVCGGIVVVPKIRLLHKITSSCGCLNSDTTAKRNFRHGGCGTRIYGIWKEMKKRCDNPAHKYFSDYGGRGIGVCDEWKSFESFRDWAMANGYADDLTIDRWPDKNGNYEPSNCRWATMKEQANNTRKNRIIEAFGESKTIAQWIRDPRCIVKWGCFYVRLSNGWDATKAMTTPSRGY